MNVVEVISSVKYTESVWMKVLGGRARSALFVGCVYMPTKSTSVAVVDSCYDRFKEDVLGFRERGDSCTRRFLASVPGLPRCALNVRIFNCAGEETLKTVRQREGLGCNVMWGVAHAPLPSINAAPARTRRGAGADLRSHAQPVN